MSKLTLKEWAARQYHTPPCGKTLRHWIKRGWIQPVPVRVGRPYWVDAKARFVGACRAVSDAIGRDIERKRDEGEPW